MQTAAFVATFVIGIVSSRRSLQLAAVVMAVGARLIYTFDQLGVLGAW